MSPVLLAILFAVASPAAAPTQPPEIYHAISRPLCSALQTSIGPALGLMIQNDRTIAKSPALFQEYLNARSSDDSRQDMAVLHLENLIEPLATNVLAIQKLLENQSVFPAHPATGDERRLATIQQQMFAALAAQQAALDIISGFVDTQQLSAMQHEGFGYISEMTGPGVGNQGNAAVTQAIGPTPDPLHPSAFDNTALQAGLTPNPNEINLASVPGLQLGYNPIGRLKDGLVWTQDQSKKAETALSSSVVEAADICGGHTGATPSPSPKP
jgi:hypothetical protein